MIRLLLFTVGALFTASTLVGCRSRASTELLEREIRARDRRIYELEYQLEKQGGSYIVAPLPGLETRTTSDRAQQALPAPPPFQNRRRPGQRLLDLLNRDLAPTPGVLEDGAKAADEAGDEATEEVENQTDTDPASPENPGVVAPGDDPDLGVEALPNAPAEAAPGGGVELGAPDGETQQAPGEELPENGAPNQETNLDGAMMKREIEAKIDLFQVAPASYLSPGDLVEEVRLIGFLCHGRFDAFDSGPSIYVVVEQLDASGRRIISPGSIAIRAKELNAEGTELGRVDYSAERCMAAAESTTLGRQLRFVLPLAHAPQGDRIKLEIAFAAADGRLLTDDIVADYVLPGRFATRNLGEPKMQSKSKPSLAPKGTNAAQPRKRFEPSAADSGDSTYQPLWKPIRR